MAMATHGQAMFEYAANAGEDNPAADWILTPYDVWMPNPHFQGVRGPHPDSSDDCYTQEECDAMDAAYFAGLDEDTRLATAIAGLTAKGIVADDDTVAVALGDRDADDDSVWF